MLLRSVPVGRLAVMVDDRVDIFPLNHVVDRTSIVVRTTAGTKLAAAAGHYVAFEADRYDPECGEAWSVIVRGFATSIEQLHEVLGALQLPLSPWQRGAKPFFLRIEPGTVTGHRSQTPC